MNYSAHPARRSDENDNLVSVAFLCAKEPSNRFTSVGSAANSALALLAAVEQQCPETTDDIALDLRWSPMFGLLLEEYRAVVHDQSQPQNYFESKEALELCVLCSRIFWAGTRCQGHYNAPLPPGTVTP